MRTEEEALQGIFCVREKRRSCVLVIIIFIELRFPDHGCCCCRCCSAATAAAAADARLPLLPRIDFACEIHWQNIINSRHHLLSRICSSLSLSPSDQICTHILMKKTAFPSRPPQPLSASLAPVSRSAGRSECHKPCTRLIAFLVSIYVALA